MEKLKEEGGKERGNEKWEREEGYKDRDTNKYRGNEWGIWSKEVKNEGKGRQEKGKREKTLRYFKTNFLTWNMLWCTNHNKPAKQRRVRQIKYFHHKYIPVIVNISSKFFLCSHETGRKNLIQPLKTRVLLFHSLQIYTLPKHTLLTALCECFQHCRI